MIKPESTGRMAAQHRGDFGGAVADLSGPAAVQRLDGGTIPVTCLDGSNHALEFGKARLADVAEGGGTEQAAAVRGRRGKGARRRSPRP